MRIAISGLSGCGNTTATHNVGKTLNLKVMNYTFRDLARDLGISYDELHHEAPSNFIYDYLTDLTLVRAALADNVVVGSRLAAKLVEADMRIWLHASLEVRARRINLRESEKHSSYESVLYKTLKRDEQNRKRYLQIYGIDIDDYFDYDVSINTEMLTAEQVSSLICAAAQWVSVNQLKRKNVHLERIQKIIANQLKLPLEALTNPNYPTNVREIFQTVRRIS